MFLEGLLGLIPRIFSGTPVGNYRGAPEGFPGVTSEEIP